MQLSLFALLFTSAATLSSQSLTGLWDATVKYGDATIPFPIEFSQQGRDVAASFFNGDDRVTSTSGTLAGHSVTVKFDDYATELKATLSDGELRGTYGGKRNGLHDFEATPHRNIPASDVKAPDIGGAWDVPIESEKGEHAWRLLVKQKGPNISAAILRVDGDTGSLTGAYRDGKFVLSHFDGARPAVLSLVLKPDGTLDVTYRAGGDPALHLAAVPLSDAVDDELPQPTDPEDHTHVKNPSEPFRFSFPDINGKIVSNTDQKFKGKVVLVNITGSWCPNCHDEAPFLADLFRKYHSRGLEIVGLDFEEPEQLQNPTRLRSFLKKYGIEYTYLIAGQPEDLQVKIPQAVNLNSWPTTFFLGRNGKVRAIHAGFAAPATGSFHTSLKRDVTERVEQLLSDPLP